MSSQDPVRERERPQRQTMLPDWMRDPPPARRTVGARVAGVLVRIPGVSRAREAWWAWRERRRLSDRFPKTVKIAAFFLAWGASVGLIMAIYACFAKSQT
jgi:hypothetical protein